MDDGVFIGLFYGGGFLLALVALFTPERFKFWKVQDVDRLSTGRYRRVPFALLIVSIIIVGLLYGFLAAYSVFIIGFPVVSIGTAIFINRRAIPPTARNVWKHLYNIYGRNGRESPVLAPKRGGAGALDMQPLSMCTWLTKSHLAFTIDALPKAGHASIPWQDIKDLLITELPNKHDLEKYDMASQLAVVRFRSSIGVRLALPWQPDFSEHVRQYAPSVAILHRQQNASE